jgi:hypothetical protein
MNQTGQPAFDVIDAVHARCVSSYADDEAPTLSVLISDVSESVDVSEPAVVETVERLERGGILHIDRENAKDPKVVLA